MDGAPAGGRPRKADGPPHRSLAPIPVRYASVDTVLQIDASPHEPLAAHFRALAASRRSVKARSRWVTVDTAFWHLNALGFDPERTILINGAGTTIGFAAVQIALLRGMRVIATAGETYARRLSALGAQVTPYGDGMVERVTEINGGPADLVLNTAPVGGALPDLVQIAGGDPKRVLTITDFAAAAELGVRDTFHEDRSNPVEALPEFGQLAADGMFTVPIAATFPLDAWKTALGISQTRHARGKSSPRCQAGQPAAPQARPAPPAKERSTLAKNL